MKYWGITLAILATLSASLVLAEDFKTVNGKEYKNATVSRVESDGIVVVTKSGISKVYFTELPKDVQKRFGYDTDKIEAAARAAKEKRVAVNPTGGQSVADNVGPIVILVGLLLLVVGGISVATYTNAKSRAAKKALDEKLTTELNDYAEAAKKANKLPTVSTALFLKAGESAFYDCPSSLYETRAVRQFQAGRVGFRVAKGVWVGGSQGQSVSNQEWSKIDDGTLTITNMRVIFEGAQGSRNIVLNKIISVQSFLDGIEVAVENRQKNLMLTAPNPYIAHSIIRFLRKAEDGEATTATA